MRFAVLACLLVASLPHQASRPSPPTRDPFCFRPLEELCARDECLTYAAQVKALKAGGYVSEIEETKAADAPCTSAGSIGRCGPFRTTHHSIGFTAETRYFDRAGTLIAVRRETDVFLGEACPFWRHYGAAITCRVTGVKLLCKPGTGR